jgi:tetratricopeptide (TPR) repeat protein
MRKFLCSLLICLVSLSAGVLVAQGTSTYDDLLRQGSDQLQAGQTQGALDAAQKAITVDPARWEAYALAGGALMNQRRNEEAADRLSDAIARAPQDKQSGLRELRRQSLAGAATAAPVASPAAVSADPTMTTTVDPRAPKPAYDELFARAGLRGAKVVNGGGKGMVLLATGYEDRKRPLPPPPVNITLDTFQNQPSIRYATADLYCRQALLYGQVGLCDGGIIIITQDTVAFEKQKGKMVFVAKRASTAIKQEGGREGDTFSIYDEKGTRYRFGGEKYDSPAVTFLLTSLNSFSDLYAALKELFATAPNGTSILP